MKSKELIEILRLLDPEGETDVVINNKPIYSVDKEAAFWDGRMFGLIREESLAPYYNVTGMYYTDEGSKIRLHTLSLLDVLVGNIDARFEIRSKTPWVKEQGTELYNRAIEEAKSILAGIEEFKTQTQE